MVFGRDKDWLCLPWSLIFMRGKAVIELLRPPAEFFAADGYFPIKFCRAIDSNPYTHAIEANTEKNEDNSTRPRANPMPEIRCRSRNQGSVN